MMHAPPTIHHPACPVAAASPSGDRTLVMGVINVTPDSFSDGGRLFDAAAAIEAGVRMVEEGADLIDVGGESTRPGAAAARRSRGTAPRAAGHRRAGGARSQSRCRSTPTRRRRRTPRSVPGASIVNDVSGLRYEPELADVVPHGIARPSC